MRDQAKEPASPVWRTPVLDPRRRRRRLRARIGAALGTAVLGLVAAKAGLTLGAQHLGAQAWRDGDLGRAEQLLSWTDRVNVAERWIAPYNLGVVAYTRLEWRRAAALFARAAETVPEESRCRVLINQSLALESLGDALAGQDDDAGAARSYREAQGVLARADGCSTEPSDDAASSDSSEPEPPSSSPEPKDSQRSDQGDDGQESQGERSERDQVDEATARLEQKMSDGRAQPAEPRDESPEEQAERLADRNEAGARQQQQSRDEAQTPGDRKQSEGRTW